MTVAAESGPEIHILHQAFNMVSSRSYMITLIGGGGKTSLMYYLAYASRAMGRRPVTITTTKLYYSAAPERPTYFVKNRTDCFRVLAETENKNTVITLAGGFDPHDSRKITGIDPRWIDTILEQSENLVCIVEGDGAAGKSLKAHASYEPVIPSRSDWVIPVIGMDIIGKPLNEHNVHRAERFSFLTGMSIGDPVTEKRIVRILTHSEGYLHNCPQRAKVIPFLNKVESPEQREAAWRIAGKFFASFSLPGIRPEGILLGSIRNRHLEYIDNLYLER
ncbi:Hypothetical protein LUCI_3991 [Lucifera butyrica]|uniref:Selenium-dependent hydroxylase accessory protein YqeC n=1 Tax=Lucifera butyrica TaxID=1351585 RepID=A0A498RF49_9FIRM|nr:selenium cofactor biosynthesis protein YqeC [Lucifera butyrica]VBB08713.1 Hypothetical protein LUCI_3991 [Lucifera butyrica]